jgi:hypothetical protein
VVNPQVREALLANFNPTGGLEKLHRIRLGTFTKLNPRDPQAKDHPLFLDFAPILKEIAKRAEREGYLASMQDLLDSFIENPIQRGRTSLLSQDLKGKPLNHRSPVFQMPDTKGAYPILRDLGFRGATDRLVRAMEESTPERFRSGFLLSVPEHLENFELNVVVVFDNLQTILNPAGQVNAFKIVTKSIIHKARGYIVYHRQPGGFVKTVYDIHLIRLPHTGFEGIEVAHIYPLTEQEDRPDMSGVTEVARIPGISPERLDLYLQEELKSQYDLFGTFLVGLHGKPKAQGTFVTGDILQNSLVEMANQGALFMHPQFAQFFDRWFKPSDPNGDALVGS